MNNIATMQPVTDSADWVGADIASGKGWLHHLDDSEIVGLRRMAASIRPLLDNDPDRLLAMPKEAFDLGAFGARLTTVTECLSHGLGLALIKGLPVAQMELIDTKQSGR